VILGKTTVAHHAFQYGWDRSREPTAIITPGTSLELELADASDGQLAPGSTAASIVAIDRKRMNPLIGPIAVEGARAGSVLQVDVLEVRPKAWGWTAIFPGFGLLASDFPGPALLIWSLAAGFAEAAGLRLRIQPFCGVLGVCPAAFGHHSVVPPRAVGGNLDTRQLVTGSTLLLPVEVDGALFGAGDPHALQGDGEICGTAIEVPADATLRLSLREDIALGSPAFHSPVVEQRIPGPYYATTGVEPDLYLACQAAIRRMIEHLGRRYGFENELAYMLCSVLVDLRVSEVVDRPNWVVSAFWPEGAVGE
jgi:acetamidase/formamidase